MSQSVILQRVGYCIFKSQRRVKIKPEKEISGHITLTSVINALFYARYLHYCSSTHGIQLAVKKLNVSSLAPS